MFVWPVQLSVFVFLKSGFKPLIFLTILFEHGVQCPELFDGGAISWYILNVF